MKVWWTIAALPAAAMWAGLAQEPARPAEPDPGFRLERAVPEDAAALEDAGRASASDFDRDAWRRALTGSDLDRREESYDRLVREHGGDAEALDVLRAWAADASAPELAWTSRLALREMTGARARRRSAFPAPPADPFERFFGRDVPFGPGLRDLGGIEEYLDSLQGRFRGGARWPFGADPFGADPFGGDPFGRDPSGSRSRSQSLRVEMGPDGVRVERTEEVDGERQVKVYEGESLEALLEAHPELEEHIEAGADAPFDPRTRLDELVPDPFQGLDDALGRLVPVRPREVPTDYLGVMVQEPSAEARGAGGERLGLRVESTVPGTIAAELGVRRDDVLLELNGTRLHTADDVRAALSARLADEAVELTLIDAAGEERTLVWRPGHRR